MQPNRAIKGLLVGLLGAALVGYALFLVLADAGCIAALAGSCPGSGWSSVWLLPAGVILAVIGSFLRGGLVIFSALFIAIGGAALAIGVLGLMPEMPSFPWLFGGLFVAGGLLPVLLGLVVRRGFAAKQAMAAELMRSGVKGIGTIVEVGDTGMTINDNPRILIRMRIEPVDGTAPVERTKKVTVSRVAIPRAGERYPAWFDRMDAEKWMYGTDVQANAPAEVKDMFARARAGGPDYDGADADNDPSPVQDLAQLTGLWRDGALTDAEFADAKARLLPRIGR
jgi:hypothetical protein